MILEKKRIFIVEDKPDNYAIAKMLLEPYGATVWFDRWGLNVIERLEQFAPVDLILLDLMYPNITGYEIFDQIRALSAFATVPIVAVSASEPAVSIPKCKERGFNGFIPKPLNYDEFPKQIEQALLGKPVWIRSS